MTKITLLYFSSVLTGLILILLIFIALKNASNLEKSQIEKAYYENKLILEEKNDSLLGFNLFKVNCDNCHHSPEQLHYQMDIFLKKYGETKFLELITAEDSLISTGNEEIIFMNKLYLTNYTHAFKLNSEEKRAIITYIK
ncbi:MAG: hypothetical protein R3B93_20455 [Bacteroidia bacterium]